jgi:hypothetical protein
MPIPMPTMIVPLKKGAALAAEFRPATEADIATGIALACDCGRCRGVARTPCVYAEGITSAVMTVAKSDVGVTPTQAAGVAEFLAAAEPMLLELADFVQASKAPGADQNATLAWDIQDPATYAVIAKVLVTRPGRGAAVAKNAADGDGVVGWRVRLKEGLEAMLVGLRGTMGIEDVAAKFASLTDAFREDLLAARREAVTSFGGSVDMARAFADPSVAKADAVAKARVAAANAAKVAELAKQAPRHVPFVWPSDLGKEARHEGLDRLLKTSDELRIRDVGEAVLHDRRREQILKGVDRDLAHLAERDRRDALRSADELGIRDLNKAVQHDNRRHELITKHRRAR